MNKYTTCEGVQQQIIAHANDSQHLSPIHTHTQTNTRTHTQVLSYTYTRAHAWADVMRNLHSLTRTQTDTSKHTHNCTRIYASVDKNIPASQYRPEIHICEYKCV